MREHIIVEMDDRDRILKPGMVVVDLGAARCGHRLRLQGGEGWQRLL